MLADASIGNRAVSTPGIKVLGVSVYKNTPIIFTLSILAEGQHLNLCICLLYTVCSKHRVFIYIRYLIIVHCLQIFPIAECFEIKYVYIRNKLRCIKLILFLKELRHLLAPKSLIC